MDKKSETQKILKSGSSKLVFAFKNLFASCIFLIVMLLVGMLVFAESLNTDIPGLSLSYTEGSWTVVSSSLFGSATGTARKMMGKIELVPAKSTTSELILENVQYETAYLAFSYSAPTLATGGYVEIDGTRVTTSGDFSKELAKNETVTVIIYSGDPGAVTSSIEITNLQLIEQKNVTTIFEPSTNGTIYVDGSLISASTSITRSSTEAYLLSAFPSNGYKLLGWFSNVNGFISSNTTCQYLSGEEQTITARFVLESSPMFDVGGQRFSDLNEAIGFSSSNNIDTILLREDGVLSSGTYTIPSGKTLLIPYDNTFFLNTTEPDSVKAAPSTPSVYKMLTLATGAEINIYGSLSVNAKVNSQNTNYTGTTTGQYGQILLNEGSNIIIKNGGKLYCWGYIIGSGEITAESGAKVYEPFAICDLRGGTATSTLVGNDYGVFPFSQYYIQNIESKLTILYGAYEYAVGNITVQGATIVPSVCFVGPSTNAMFKLSAGGSFIKKYDSNEDRVLYEVYGNAALNSLIMTVSVTINSADYFLPIMENTSIIIHSGTTSVSQDLFLIPGFEMLIDEDATVTVSANTNIIAYDRNEWVGNKYVYSDTDLRTSFYSPTRLNSNKFNVSKMKDAIIDINGTINTSGNLFTTASGAAIISSKKSGKIIFTSEPVSETTTYQATQSGTVISYSPIICTAPQLLNGDGSYTATAGATAGSTFVYCPVCDKWVLENEHNNHTFTITWNNWDGTPLEVDENVPYGQMPSYDAEMPQKAADDRFEYRFASWYKKPSTVTGDTVYVAEFYAIDPAKDNAAIADDLVFTKKSVTLFNSLALNYKIDPENLSAMGYSNAYVIATLAGNGNLLENNGETDDNGRLIYLFNNVGPHLMNTTIYSVIYAEKDGVFYRSHVIEYSLAQYCVDVLRMPEYAESTELRRLIVDLMEYGSASQVFAEYRTDDLAWSLLTASEVQEGTTDIPTMTDISEQIETVSNPSVTWSGRGLYLDDSVQIRLKIKTTVGTSGLKIVIKNIADDTWTFSSSKFVPIPDLTDEYYIFFNGFNFGQLSEPIYATVYDASNNVLSPTQVFSVESYCAIQYNNPQTTLSDIVVALMKVGTSAKIYANG